MKGWIKLHRQIRNHWVFKNPLYFQAWITILLEVNHKKSKVLVGSTLFDINPGESIKSLDSWATIFGGDWTKQKVRTFFSLLQKDGMINTQNKRITTHLTVCNYATYQYGQHANDTGCNTAVTHKQHTDNTLITPNNNDNNNIKNEKECGINTLASSYPRFYKKVKEVWLKHYGCEYPESDFLNYHLQALSYIGMDDEKAEYALNMVGDPKRAFNLNINMRKMDWFAENMQKLYKAWIAMDREFGRGA